MEKSVKESNEKKDCEKMEMVVSTIFSFLRNNFDYIRPLDGRTRTGLTSLAHDKILHVSKLIRFADDNLNSVKKNFFFFVKELKT